MEFLDLFSGDFVISSIKFYFNHICAAIFSHYNILTTIVGFCCYLGLKSIESKQISNIVFKSVWLFVKFGDESSYCLFTQYVFRIEKFFLLLQLIILY